MTTLVIGSGLIGSQVARILVEQAKGVRPKLQGRADARNSGRLLVDGDIETVALERDRSGETADAAADDRDPHFFSVPRVRRLRTASGGEIMPATQRRQEEAACRAK